MTRREKIEHRNIPELRARQSAFTSTSATNDAMHEDTVSIFSLSQNRRLLQRYHLLIDKRLKGKLSPKLTAELQKIEQTLQALEDAQTSEFMRVHEERHDMMMQKLGELTAELRKIAVGSQPRSQASHSKAR